MEEEEEGWEREREPILMDGWIEGLEVGGEGS
jgi:hypothetical protein